MKTLILSVVIAFAVTAGAQTDFKGQGPSDKNLVYHIPTGSKLVFNNPIAILPNEVSTVLFQPNQIGCRLLHDSSGAYRLLSGEFEMVGRHHYNDSMVSYYLRDENLNLTCNGLNSGTTIGELRSALSAVGIELVLASAIAF